MRTIIVTLAALAAAFTGPTTFAQAGEAGGYPAATATATTTATVPDRSIRATPYGTMTADGTYAERLAAAEEMPYYVGGPAANDATGYDPTPAERAPTREPSNESVFDRDASALAWILGIGALALVFSALMATLRSQELDPTPIDASSFTDRHRTAAH